MFYRYCVAKVKKNLGRILTAFGYNLPGGVTVNADIWASQAQEELQAVMEEIKSEQSVGYFITA